ncbi:hypothetical protein [Luminiphilus sp. nBUS_07]|uniref:hypothetical protein n=1 Tax=Luminiphilus sp. nBUS_07 TaxID=3395314 RepID=UPI003EB6AAD8
MTGIVSLPQQAIAKMGAPGKELELRDVRVSVSPLIAQGSFTPKTAKFNGAIQRRAFSMTDRL